MIMRPGPEATKIMLISAEHKILNAHKYNNIKKLSLVPGPDKPIMLFFLRMNVKMPTNVGILTIMSRKTSRSTGLRMIFFTYSLWTKSGFNNLGSGERPLKWYKLKFLNDIRCVKSIYLKSEWD